MGRTFLETKTTRNLVDVDHDCAIILEQSNPHQRPADDASDPEAHKASWAAANAPLFAMKDGVGLVGCVGQADFTIANFIDALQVSATANLAASAAAHGVGHSSDEDAEEPAEGSDDAEVLGEEESDSDGGSAAEEIVGSVATEWTSADLVVVSNDSDTLINVNPRKVNFWVHVRRIQGADKKYRSHYEAISLPRLRLQRRLQPFLKSRRTRALFGLAVGNDACGGLLGVGVGTVLDQSLQAVSSSSVGFCHLTELRCRRPSRSWATR